MAKYRRKPLVVEAWQWHVGDFLIGPMEPVACEPTEHCAENMHYVIPTVEGDYLVSDGDWIIKGVAGTFYSCAPDIFEQTYEAV